MIATPWDYMARADEDVAVASELLARGHSRTAISRAYYAMFYAATAVLYHNNLAFRKHSGVIAGFGKHIAAEGLIDARHHIAFTKAFDLRHRADYEVAARLTFDEAARLVADAREFVQAARDYLTAERSE